MLLVHQIRQPLHSTPQDAIAAALAQLSVSSPAVLAANIHKVSVDARHGKPLLVYTVAVQLHSAQQEETLAHKLNLPLVTPQAVPLALGTEKLGAPVLVCGLGPAGLFAALELAQAGFFPIVLERGPEMAARRAAVQSFETGGALLPDANIQFGEGGAGTFSDGKLTTRIKDPLCDRVLQHLLQAGAPQEIAFAAKPHIGTDILQDVFVSLRNKLVALGGRVLFNTKLTGLVLCAGRLAAVQTTAGEMPCGALVLAVGHSARDTFTALSAAGLPLQPKAFSVGFRMEHLQSEIDRALYHEAAGHPALPPGEYQLSTKVQGRGVYTFCMCPGGSVVAAASEQGGVVTNGMSLHARAGANANAALVAGVSCEDFGADPFAGIAFQRSLEQAAFAAGGADYTAPAQTVDCFLQGQKGLRLAGVQPTYSRGTTPCDLGKLLQGNLVFALQTGLRSFGRKLRGYDAPHAVLTGLETRTSSPVRILRCETLESTSLPGLWPCGEGAGYAGGIMSAATDGIRVAFALAARYKAE